MITVPLGSARSKRKANRAADGYNFFKVTLNEEEKDKAKAV